MAIKNALVRNHVIAMLIGFWFTPLGAAIWQPALIQGQTESSPVSAIAISHDEQYVVAGYKSGVICLFERQDDDTWKHVRSRAAELDNAVALLEFDPDSGSLIAGYVNGEMQILDLDFHVMQTLAVKDGSFESSEHSMHARYSADGNVLVTAVPERNSKPLHTVKLWKLDGDGKWVARRTIEDVQIKRLALSPDGTKLGFIAPAAGFQLWEEINDTWEMRANYQQAGSEKGGDGLFLSDDAFQVAYNENIVTLTRDARANWNITGLVYHVLLGNARITSARNAMAFSTSSDMVYARHLVLGLYQDKTITYELIVSGRNLDIAEFSKSASLFAIGVKNRIELYNYKLAVL